MHSLNFDLISILHRVSPKQIGLICPSLKNAVAKLMNAPSVCVHIIPTARKMSGDLNITKTFSHVANMCLPSFNTKDVTKRNGFLRMGLLQ